MVGLQPLALISTVSRLTRFPTELWVQAVKLAPLFNRLVDRVSQDSAYLREALEPVLGQGE